MKNKILAYKEHLKNPNLIAVLLAILTTGFLRLQLMLAPPASDSGIYTLASQWFYNAISQDIPIKDSKLYLYQFMTAWVYGLEVNQIILLRIIDCFVAIAASIILFNVILKESGSKLFTVIFMASLLIILHDFIYVLFGFRNSIWAAYLPLFSALLVWQNASKEDKFSFYLIGALVSLGILLREAFLPFFLFTFIAIYISYGRRQSLNYMIGSALLSFSVLSFILMFRGWDLNNLIDRYIFLSTAYNDYKDMGITFAAGMLNLIKTGWFICTLSLASILYFIKLKLYDKKTGSVNRIYFWVFVALLPLIEPIFKVGFDYHYSNFFIGLAGLSALCWKYLSLHESKQTKKLSTLLIGMMSLFVIVPTVISTIIKSEHIYSPSEALKWANNPNSFRGSNTMVRNQYSKMAAMIYENSREDSTLAASGMMQVLYPLTELLPPTFELSNLRILHLKNNEDEEKIIKSIMKYRPTLIVTTAWTPGEIILSEVIGKIDIYEKVGNIPLNPKINYGWKSGIIYRLKDFN